MERLSVNRMICAAAAALTVLAVAAGSAGAGTRITVSSPVDVSRDQTSQNETPLAINPQNPANMITGANDWNYNDGCAVNATADGGKTWTPTFPNGLLPGITSFTNAPTVAGA